ncbi:RNA polymerase sigma factor [Balneola sp. MJW-20]|uniref:RNA polymerase sigma factor n=1 Tax=Gracilimonas aurantiaca TaxID=3234185 RepID=UPI003467610B
MDYGELVSAIKNNEKGKTESLLNKLRPTLIKFLLVHVNASKQDAEDCAQNTLLIAIEKIRGDHLTKPEAVISYLLTTAKHEYLKTVGRNREYTFEEFPVTPSQSADQLFRLLEKEKIAQLNACVKKLDPGNREFIQYWFDHPNHEAAVVADKFKMSVNNVWTKKHRIIKELQLCLQKNE